MSVHHRNIVAQNLRQVGMTLIELLVALAIVGIASAIAVPAYKDYSMRGKIPDATSNLATKRIKLEQFYQDNRTYVDATDCSSDTTTSQYFDFSCSGTTTATAFTLQAVGKGAMAGFTFTINQAGVKATTAVPTGWTLPSSNCWVTRKEGTC